MPAVTYSIVTLTLDYSYGLTPPVYLMASWTHRPWAARLMLVKNWQHETEYQSERHEFEISLNIPPGPCLYRYRLGYEDSESFICDHQEKIVTWNGVEYNSIMIGDETSGYQESDHSAISQNEDTCHWSAPFGHETSSESPPEAEDQHYEEGVFPFEQHSTSTPPETAVHTQLSSETLPGQSPSAPLGENAIGGDGRRPPSGRTNVKSKIGRSVPEGGANSSGGHLNASAPR